MSFSWNTFIYDIPDYIFDSVESFANERIENSKELYKYRGENNVNKMKEDIIVGTLGEWAVYDYFNAINQYCTPPDVELYETKRKSYDADLKTNELNVHVKSQSLNSSKRYGYSWLFQKSDPLVKEPEDNDILAFTSVDLDSRKVAFLGLTYADDITEERAWSDCKVSYFNKTKRALYLDDLVKKKIFILPWENV